MNDMGLSSTSIAELNRLLAGRYRVERVLGEGAHGVTYLATTAQGRQVALKELAVARVESWKAIELFEREGQALQALSHPAIPAYEEAFHLDDGWGGERFFLAQAYVEGRDPGSELGRGLRGTETLGGPLTLRGARGSMLKVLQARREVVGRAALQSLSSRGALRSNSKRPGAREPVAARVAAGTGASQETTSRRSQRAAMVGWVLVAVLVVATLVALFVG